MRIVLVALLMLANTSAWAEWERLGETDEFIQYIDPATIRKDGNFIRVWALQDRQVQNADGVRSIRALEEYECKQVRSRLLSLSVHSGSMATGNVINVGNSGLSNRPSLRSSAREWHRQQGKDDRRQSRQTTHVPRAGTRS